MACSLEWTLTALTGDCSNTNQGGFEINIDGSAPPYVIQWIEPYTNTEYLSVGQTTYLRQSLSGGTYRFNIMDACNDPAPIEEAVQVYISTGFCTSITSISNTVCDVDNASITAQTQYDYGNYKWHLFNSLGFVKEGITSDDLTPHGAIFEDLEPGSYYVKVSDDGGCSATTNNIIIQPSASFDFNLYKVDNSSCTDIFPDTGKVFVISPNGLSPYTYEWVKDGTVMSGEENSSITGLTEGTYSVTVTDRGGCSLSKSVTVKKADPIGQIGVPEVQQPSCYHSDGTACIFFSGGTPPYFFSGSNGTSLNTFQNEVTLTGLPPGPFNYVIQDAGLCTYFNSFTLKVPKAISMGGFEVIDSSCGNNQGIVKALVSDGSPPYDFTLQSITPGLVYYKNFNGPALLNVTYNNLKPGNYLLTIKDEGPCEIIRQVTVNDISEVGFTYSVVGTTCGSNDGSVTINITKGLGLYTYEIKNLDNTYTQTESNSIETSHTFSDLFGDTYIIGVYDEDLACRVEETINIQSSNGFELVACPVNPSECNNGSISLLVGAAKPPITIVWSNNVNGQTGQELTNLSAGTYSVTVTDANGCVTEETITLAEGVCPASTYEIFQICNDEFVNNGLLKKDTLFMLKEGYGDLTNGDVNCVLNKSIFEAITVVGDVTATTQFYTGYTLSEVPSDALFSGTVKTMLQNYEGIGNVVIDMEKNKVTISSDCESETSLVDTKIQVYLKIYYDISCESCFS